MAEVRRSSRDVTKKKKTMDYEVDTSGFESARRSREKKRRRERRKKKEEEEGGRGGNGKKRKKGVTATATKKRGGAGGGGGTTGTRRRKAKKEDEEVVEAVEQYDEEDEIDEEEEIEEEDWMAHDEEEKKDAKQSLRSSWEFAAVVHWCRTFGDTLLLPAFAAETLEEELLRETWKQEAYWDDALEQMVAAGSDAIVLSELVLKLSRAGMGREGQAKRDPFQLKLFRKLERVKNTTELLELFPHGNPMTAETGWAPLSPRQKLRVLYLLCVLRTEECPLVRDAVKRTVDNPEYTAVALRNESFGIDADGRQYYVFSHQGEDCYVYRERAPASCRPGRKVEWETVTTTMDEVRDLAERFRKSRVPGEKGIFRFLMDIHIPRLEEAEHERERQRKRLENLQRIAAMPRKRSSRIAKNEAERHEAEVARKIAEEEEKEEVERLRREALVHARETRRYRRDVNTGSVTNLYAQTFRNGTQDRNHRLQMRSAGVTDDNVRRMYRSSGFYNEEDADRIIDEMLEDEEARMRADDDEDDDDDERAAHANGDDDEEYNHDDDDDVDEEDDEEERLPRDYKRPEPRVVKIPRHATLDSDGDVRDDDDEEESDDGDESDCDDDDDDNDNGRDDDEIDGYESEYDGEETKPGVTKAAGTPKRAKVETPSKQHTPNGHVANGNGVANGHGNTGSIVGRLIKDVQRMPNARGVNLPSAKEDHEAGDIARGPGLVSEIPKNACGAAMNSLKHESPLRPDNGVRDVRYGNASTMTQPGGYRQPAAPSSPTVWSPSGAVATIHVPTNYAHDMSRHVHVSQAQKMAHHPVHAMGTNGQQQQHQRQRNPNAAVPRGLLLATAPPQLASHSHSVPGHEMLMNVNAAAAIAAKQVSERGST